MEVVNNNQKLRVCWMYNHSFVPDSLTQLGASIKESESSKRMSAKKQLELLEKYAEGIVEALGLNNFAPDTTYCLIYNGKDVVASASVVKYYKDADNRDKARKYSLAKALATFLPDDKKGRTAFWNAYLTRSVQPAAVQPVLGVSQ